ncbi:MAG: type II toxin-antitoxin system VapC family toxin [Planctomycetes bacterium]|nr:type II toxin-antitoxin system VapC family toxin [Planctomycetota bacterium]
MKRSLYLESTIPSYLVAAPSRDLLIAAHQQVTAEWWRTRRIGFDLYVSQFILDEIGRGDAEVAKRRLEAVKGIPLLDITEDVLDPAAGFLALKIIPRRAGTDAVHIAVATVHGVDFLLTWNCRHIANAAIIRDIEAVCRMRGFQCPVICTPEELMEGSHG